MSPDEAQVTHRIPGRFRVKVPARRHDPDFFNTVARRLSEFEGVIQVASNPVTGTVLVIHSTAITAIADYAAREGLFSLLDERDRLDDIPWSAVVPRWPSLHRGPHGNTEQRQQDSGARTLSASLSSLGIMQTLRGQFMAPGVTLFWYAYDAWRARPSRRPAIVPASDKKIPR